MISTSRILIPDSKSIRIKYYFFPYYLFTVYGLSIPENVLREMLHYAPNDIENK